MEKKGALIKKKGRGDKDKIIDGEKAFIKGKRERGEEINHKYRQDQTAAYQQQPYLLRKKSCRIKSQHSTML